MLRPEHVRRFVIQPVLARLAAVESALNSPAAEELLMGTWIYESGRSQTALEQLPHGPALGIFQMEPRTHADHRRWLGRGTKRDILAHAVNALMVEGPSSQIAWNLQYACAMARIHYWRRPEPMPDVDDIPGLADTWKRHYNTAAGKGDPRAWARVYRKYALPSRPKTVQGPKKKRAKK